MMRFSILSILLWLTSLCCANLSYANTIDLLCEGEIETLQQLTTTPSKWHISANQKAIFSPANSKTRHALSAISFAQTSESAMTLVPPERTTISKSNQQAFVSTWQFKPAQSIHYVCSYWDTAIQLSKTLPRKASTCYVEGKRDGSAIKAWCEIVQQPVDVIETRPDTSTNATTASTNEAPAEDVALTPIVTPDQEDILPKALSVENLPSDNLETADVQLNITEPLVDSALIDEDNKLSGENSENAANNEIGDLEANVEANQINGTQ